MLIHWVSVSVLFAILEQSSEVQIKSTKIERKKPVVDQSEVDHRKNIKDRTVYLSGSSFQMGSDDRNLLKTGEFPLKHLKVKPFSIDQYPVTNEDFMTFKYHKSKYVTDAERSGHSWVFSRHKTDTARYDGLITHRDGPIWQAVKNATWEQPNGPGSSVEDRRTHPVVHVSYYDAYSYCVYAGKRLPTEHEWEYAARAGKNGTRFPWGNATEVMRSNLWQGRFPDINSGKDGYDRTSPVDAFQPQNDFGLYDMIGNVWEWTSTVYTVPRVASDPENPEYVAKGGSYMDLYEGLVGHEVRNSARQGFHPNYSATNLGFRCCQSGQSARPPVRHRLEDTWEYKVKQAVKDAVGSMRQSGQFPDEL